MDTREPPIISDLLASQCPIPVVVKQLTTGDFLCENVVIERKTINDFCSSICDKRLWEQRERMLKEFQYQYIFVTGTPKERTSNIHIHAIWGALASVLVSGVKVCFGLDSEEDLVYLVLKTMEKHGKLKMVSSKKEKEKPVEKPNDTHIEEMYIDFVY